MRRFCNFQVALGPVLIAALLAGCNGERGSTTPGIPAGTGPSLARAMRATSGSIPPQPCPTPNAGAARSKSNPRTVFPPGTIVRTFTSANTEVHWFAPPGVSQVAIAVYGAQGTDAPGGCVSGVVDITPMENFYINVGGLGEANGSGGYNGGGNGGISASGYPGGGGGGASDVRIDGSDTTDRTIVAGGGGGSSGGGWIGGAGGGNVGGAGTSSTGAAGKGGTQSAGGDPQSKFAGPGNLADGGFGAFENGTKSAAFYSGGGGGGGYYGGGGGNASVTSKGLYTGDGGGGGGSSYADPKRVKNISSQQGDHYGPGLVTVSWLPTIKTIVSDLDNPVAIDEDTSGNLYLANAKPHITVYKPDGTLLYKIGGGYVHVTDIAVDSQKPPNVYVLDGHTIYLVKPPYLESIDTRIAIDKSAAAFIAVDQDYLYVATTIGDIGSGQHHLEYHALDPQTHEPAQKSGYTVSLSGVISAVAAGSCRYEQQCSPIVSEYADNLPYPYRHSRVLRIGPPPGLVKTETFNGAPFYDVVAMAEDATETGYLVDSVGVLKTPIGRPAEAIGTNWEQPLGVAVNRTCPSFCDVYVLDANDGGEIKLVTGLGR